MLAGAGTGKTTVIARRIAWLIAARGAKPDEILALTFTDKAAVEMEERVDLLLPYGSLDVWISTFHAFGDRILRDEAVAAGLSPQTRILSKAEQVVLLREHLFELPLARFRPLHDPTRYLEALVSVIARAKDEAASPEEFLAVAKEMAEGASRNPDDAQLRQSAADARELAELYAAYQRLLRQQAAIDFGDQVLETIRLFEQQPGLLQRYQGRFNHIHVDEFQDTNNAHFRLLQLLAVPQANVTVVCDDDQSIYKWRGAAISNVLKFLEHYRNVRRVVLTENFRSSQAILDCAYRVIRFNDPERLEVKEQIDKRLVAMKPLDPVEPTLAVFDRASSEADWVARQIQAQVESGRRPPGDFAILVRTNREADLFLRAMNVCGLPWQFSGLTSLFAREEIKLLVSCLKTLADPEDSLSWYHVISSSLYDCPMEDLLACLARARRTNRSLRSVLEEALGGSAQAAVGVGEAGGQGTPPPLLGEAGAAVIRRLLADVRRLQELSRQLSPGQLLYRWLTDTGWLKQRAALERVEDVEQLQAVAQFFDQLYRFERLLGNRLPELMQSLEMFQSMSEAPVGEFEGVAMDRVNVLTVHKAKGLEFPVVFVVGLVQGRFPTSARREAIELPEPLIKDLLPSGDYHLQEERRLFYVAMTRAKEELYLTAAYDYGGRSVRKLSQFVLEALRLATPSPTPITLTAQERIERSQPPPSAPAPASAKGSTPAPELLRLDAHGADDYLTCPLKFRYSHLLRIPILRHHLVMYGSALHRAIELFFKRQLAGCPMSEPELLAAFEEAWSSEGFLSREHEQLRLEQGREVLRRFAAQQQRAPESPSLIEEKFNVRFEDIQLVGRWDRVDRQGDEVVIIDYKSSEVTKQAEADRRARESLQMGAYALAWTLLHGPSQVRVELRFLETGVIGRAAPSADDLEKAKQQLLEAAHGIRFGDFSPKPQAFTCRWCAYQAICPSAAV
ncbi:MAG: ATP-dependent helicase [Candidatus Omnitrophica bacterium]|nr:ATP-dependent helicase [Candidatus Omnitrophota bacterium]